MSDDQQAEKSFELLDLLPNRESVLIGLPDDGFFFEMSRGKIVGYLTAEKFDQLYHGECGRIPVEDIPAQAVHRQYPLERFWAIFYAKVRGHVRYYGVLFNTRALSAFVFHATRIACQWLNRRSQRRSFTWGAYRAYMVQRSLACLAVYHANGSVLSLFPESGTMGCKRGEPG